MKKILLICLFLGISSLAAPIFSQTPQPTATPEDDKETDVIKVSTTLIKVDVVVTDKKNRPVTNLKLEDFEVYENGKKQEVTSFSYVSSKSKNKSQNSSADVLELGNKVRGITLKEEIGIPTTNKPLNSSDIRRTLVLVVDNLGLNFKSLQLVKRSLKEFINEEIKSGDLATIVTTSGSSVLPAFTSNKKELLAVVKKLKWNPQSRGGTDDYEPIRTTLLEDLSDMAGSDLPGVAEEAALLEDIDRGRKSNSAAGTISSLNYIVNGMRELSGRKALVLFSEGFSVDERSSQESSTSGGDSGDSGTPPPAMNSRFSSGVSGALNSLIKTANQSSVVIYAIDPRGLTNLGMANADDDIRQAMGRNFRPGLTGDKRTARADYFRQTQDGLRVLAKETGGFAVLNQNNLDKGLKRIMDDQSYYLLTYETDLEAVNSSNDVIDKVEIKVKEDGLKVRYRKAFYSADSNKNAMTIARTPREKIGQALAFPFRANEVKLNLYSITGNDVAGDFVRFLINISAEDLEFKRESQGNRKANFDILAITLDVNGKPVNQFVKNFSITVDQSTYKKISKEGFVYVLPVLLKKSGVYHFRVAVRDSKTGKVGAAAKFVETPKFEKNNLWISNIALRSDSDSTDKESAKKVFTDTTRREFSLPVTLNYGAVVYNAKTNSGNSPDLELRTRLIRDDKIILETPPGPVSVKDQKDLQRIDLSGRIKIKKNLPPGNYIFQVIVTDKLAKKKSQIATQWIDFEVF